MALPTLPLLTAASPFLNHDVSFLLFKHPKLFPLKKSLLLLLPECSFQIIFQLAIPQVRYLLVYHLRDILSGHLIWRTIPSLREAMLCDITSSLVPIIICNYPDCLLGIFEICFFVSIYYSANATRQGLCLCSPPYLGHFRSNLND